MDKLQPVSKTSSILKSESGSVLILSLIMLAMLTIIGVTLTATSTVEVQISGNERIHNMAFYAAESGWQLGVTWLDSKFPPITDNQTTSQMIHYDIYDRSASSFLLTNSLTNDNSSRYSMNIRFMGAPGIPVAGYSADSFIRYTYFIDSRGVSTATGSGGNFKGRQCPRPGDCR